MHQNKLFSRTRIRLALWYAGVIGIVLGAFGFGVYAALAYVYERAVDREIESLAATLHDSLESILVSPGRTEPEIERFFPDFCTEEDCSTLRAARSHHLVSPIAQGNYYLRLLDFSGDVVAVAGIVPQDSTPQAEEWHTLTDTEGDRYHQFTTIIHTQTGADWGYLQVGRNLHDLDSYLSAARWVLMLGLLLSLLLVGFISWGLASLAMQPVYQSYRQIQQFTEDAAHELQTPLAALQASIESTLRVETPTLNQTLDTLHAVDRQNRRLSHLVKDLLFLSRMKQRAVPHGCQPCCLQDLIDDVEEELAVLAVANGVKLVKEIRATEPLSVVGNEAQLYRAIYNIASNAIRYTPEGGRVTISLDRIPPHAFIQIRDTGIGIAPEHQPRIFDRFYRVESDRSRRTGGSGLGLAIAREILRTHNGRIQVQSKLGCGSTFTVRLNCDRF